MIFNAFISTPSPNGIEDLRIDAPDREGARENLADMFRRRGFEATLSPTSEEVWLRDQNGAEAVYYGFVSDGRKEGGDIPRKGTVLSPEAAARQREAQKAWLAEKTTKVTFSWRREKVERYKALAQASGSSLSGMIQALLDRECERAGLGK